MESTLVYAAKVYLTGHEPPKVEVETFWPIEASKTLISIKLDASKLPPSVVLNYFFGEDTADKLGVFALEKAFGLTEKLTWEI